MQRLFDLARWFGWVGLVAALIYIVARETKMTRLEEENIEFRVNSAKIKKMADYNERVKADLEAHKQALLPR